MSSIVKYKGFGLSGSTFISTLCWTIIFFVIILSHTLSFENWITVIFHKSEISSRFVTIIYQFKKCYFHDNSWQAFLAAKINSRINDSSLHWEPHQQWRSLVCILSKYKYSRPALRCITMETSQLCYWRNSKQDFAR